MEWHSAGNGAVSLQKKESCSRKKQEAEPGETGDFHRALFFCAYSRNFAAKVIYIFVNPFYTGESVHFYRIK